MVIYGFIKFKIWIFFTTFFSDSFLVKFPTILIPRCYINAKNAIGIALCVGFEVRYYADCIFFSKYRL